ncbi:cobaltochelatase subunit [compost metagenome]
MEERQITVSGKTYKLPRLFMAMATQNPVEQEGTYNLPEAQLDRFLMKVKVDYPSPQSEKTILDLVRGEHQRKYAESETSPVQAAETAERLDRTVIFQAWQAVAEIHVSEAIKDYIVGIIHASRYPDRHDPQLAQWLSAGGSPRASLGLDRASRAHAWLAGRDYVDASDVQAVVHDVLRHRLVLSFQAAAAGVKVEAAIDRILSLVIAG